MTRDIALMDPFNTGILPKLLIAWALIALCVVIHAGGVIAAMRWMRNRSDAISRFWPMTWMLIRVAAWMVLLHLIEIAAWALVFHWQDAMPDLHTAFYFSAVTYTTTGYGDILLPEAWRLAGGIEALTGILMCGWSTGFFFAVVSRVFQAQSRTLPP
jgi:hypothetical protein